MRFGKGKYFKRPCSRCGKLFKKTGKYNKICLDCQKKSRPHIWRNIISRIISDKDDFFVKREKNEDGDGETLIVNIKC